MIEEGTGLNIPHSTIRRVIADDGLSMRQPNKGRRRKGIRYECTYSNSMWHTDYKLLRDGRWFIAYEDDVSKFITGYGVFGEVTTAHAIEVLHKAIDDHGKPASILTNHVT